MKKIWIDSTKIHDIKDTSIKFFVSTPIEGLTFPSLRVGSFANASQDGVTVVSSFAGERRITLTGKVMADTPSDLITQRQKLASLLYPDRDDNDYPNTRILKFEAMDGTTYRVECQVVGAQMPQEFLTHNRFLIDLLATKTVIEHDTESTTTVSPYQLGGVVIPAEVPAAYDAGEGGTKVVTNSGDVATYPVLTLSGQLTNPRIENTTTGKFMALTHTVGSLETVTIDMRERTIMQGGVTNLINTKSGDSRFWKLEPGDNVIKLTTGVTGESGNVEISYRNAFVGV